jgi:hypothetical protein
MRLQCLGKTEQLKREGGSSNNDPGQMDEAKTPHAELNVSTHFYILLLGIHKPVKVHYTVHFSNEWCIPIQAVTPTSNLKLLTENCLYEVNFIYEKKCFNSSDP